MWGPGLAAWRVLPEEEWYLRLGRARRVGCVDRVVLFGFSVERPDRALLRLLRIGGADQLAEGPDRILSPEAAWDRGTRGHEGDEVLQERLPLVHGVEPAGILGGEPRHPHRHDLEPGLFDLSENRTDLLGA